MAGKGKKRAKKRAGEGSGASRGPDPGVRRDRSSSRTGSRLWPWIGYGAGLAVAAVLTLLLVVYPETHGPGEGRDVELVLAPGESADALAQRLAAAGLVRWPRVFALYLKMTGRAAAVAPGTHLLTDDLSPGALMARIERRGSAGKAKVTIPEGYTRFDIGKRLAQAHVCTSRAWLDATSDPALLAELHIEGASAEGYLFPATYELTMDSAAADVVRRLKVELDRRYAALESAHQPAVLELSRDLGWGEREILTLASMVEKEAAVDEERPMIASVFLNRLRDPSFTPKLLQCDPTAGYGCLAAPERSVACAGYAGKVTHDIVSDAWNPYNTYKHEGLPPGPISNPGAKSIEAVLAPATTRYLYFVARGEGRHTFSETYAAHAAAVHNGGRAPAPGSR